MTDTEQQWLDAVDPAPMLAFLIERHKANRTNAGKRRLRLFACACMRRRWELIKEPLIREVVALCERYADGQATEKELTAAEGRVEKWWRQHMTLPIDSCLGAAAYYSCRPGMTGMWPQYVAYQMGFARGAAAAGPMVPGWNHELFVQVQRGEAREQTNVLRDIFGNPFRPLRRCKFSADLRSLAQGCYEGDVSLYPILADALADAGEEAAAAHCRQDGHARGCHVVDWVRS
jgi:hypothetical protein